MMKSEMRWQQNCWVNDMRLLLSPCYFLVGTVSPSDLVGRQFVSEHRAIVLFQKCHVGKLNEPSQWHFRIALWMENTTQWDHEWQKPSIFSKLCTYSALSDAFITNPSSCLFSPFISLIVPKRAPAAELYRPCLGSKRCVGQTHTRIWWQSHQFPSHPLSYSHVLVDCDLYLRTLTTTDRTQRVMIGVVERANSDDDISGDQ